MLNWRRVPTNNTNCHTSQVWHKNEMELSVTSNDAKLFNRQTGEYEYYPLQFIVEFKVCSRQKKPDTWTYDTLSRALDKAFEVLVVF